MDEPAETLDQVIELDGEGDLILVVRGADADSNSSSRQFLVASKVLILASRVFGKMLSPAFKEGQQLRKAGEENSAKPPTITLEKDCVDAMDFILSTLHYNNSRLPNLTAMDIVNIAIQSDKYDCNTALMPWIDAWCDLNRFPLEVGNKLRDIGFGLLAAYLFSSPKFHNMARHYAKELPLDFATTWEEYEILSLLPKPVWKELATNIRRVLNWIRRDVLGVIDNLHIAPPRSSRPLCQKCGHCPGVKDYLDAMKLLGVWPSLTMLHEGPVNVVVRKIEQFRGEVRHHCASGPKCSVRNIVRSMVHAVQRHRDNIGSVSLLGRS